MRKLLVGSMLALGLFLTLDQRAQATFCLKYQRCESLYLRFTIPSFYFGWYCPPCNDCGPPVGCHHGHAPFMPPGMMSAMPFGYYGGGCENGACPAPGMAMHGYTAPMSAYYPQPMGYNTAYFGYGQVMPAYGYATNAYSGYAAAPYRHALTFGGYGY